MNHVLMGAKSKQIYYVPGEHDTSIDDGKLYLERYGKALGVKGNDRSADCRVDAIQLKLRLRDAYVLLALGDS